MKTLFWACALLLFTTAASAEELVFGMGYTDFPKPGAANTGTFAAEAHFDPFYSIGNIDVSLGAMVSFDTEQNVFFGAGLVNKHSFNDLWFAELSSMMGAFFQNDPSHDLGKRLEFRHILAIGRNLGDRHAISLGWTHTSNGNLGRFNPGKNDFLLRWHTRY